MIRTVGKVISTILFDLYQIDVRYSRKEESFLFFTVFDKKVQSIAIIMIKHIYIYSLIRKASEGELRTTIVGFVRSGTRYTVILGTSESQFSTSTTL